MSRTVTSRIQEGRFGMKSGDGLFDYTPERIGELQAERARKLVAACLVLESDGTGS